MNQLFLSLIYLGGVFLFIVLAGLFSGLETAFVCTDYLKIKSLKKGRLKSYSNLEKFYLNPESFLSLTLIGTNFCIVVISILFTLILIRVKVNNPSFWATLILSPVLFLFGELIPKSIGRIFKERFLLHFLNLLGFLESIFRPFIKAIEFLPLLVVKLLFKKGRIPQPLESFSPSRREVLSRDDFKIMTETLHSEGEIDRVEKEAIVDILGFYQSKVKDVYIDLDKVVFLKERDSQEEILNTAKKFGFTRYPVFKEGKVLGYINIFDLFYKSYKDWRELIRPILKVGINQDLSYVFKILRSKKENIALVFKGRRPYGIITLQDIMREIIFSLTHF
ncbi:MAG: DUF21 domain-containing protein [Candidatus Omnitrophica bacterium]|nr:DUF21 domain-containing protein [Candidatus Omnitrophota bacterium]